jgi:Tfp pilus assembly major pilin PilA
MASIVELSEEVNQLADTLDTIACSQKEAENFSAFKSAIDWAREFLEMLHNSEKDDDWLDELFSLVRGSTSCIRRLSTSDKESLSICETILPSFQRLVKAATTTVTEITNWVNGVDYRLLSRWETENENERVTSSEDSNTEAAAMEVDDDVAAEVEAPTAAATATVSLSEIEEIAQKAAGKIIIRQSGRFIIRFYVCNI